MRGHRSHRRAARVNSNAPEQIQLQPLRNPWVADNVSSSSHSNVSTPNFPASHSNVLAPNFPASRSKVLAPSIPAREEDKPIREAEVGQLLTVVEVRQPLNTNSSASPGVLTPSGVSWDQCCSTVVQSALVGGALTGVALIISGISLDTQHGGQLIVLVYIGTLLSLVSVVLLVIHCYVALKKTQRPRPRRTTVQVV